MMKMLTLSNARTIFAAAAFFALPMVAKADFAKTNPVTGATENYTWNSEENSSTTIMPRAYYLDSNLTRS